MKKSKIPFFILLLSAVFSFNSCDNNKTPALQQTDKQKYQETKTIEDLKLAYISEISRSFKYLEFSKKADEEGYRNIALLYNAFSASENVHARNHKIVLESLGETVSTPSPTFETKTTIENLQNGIEEESHDAEVFYPEFLKDACKKTADLTGNQTACLSLTYAMKSERKHKFLFEQALSDINNNKLNSLPSAYFVCPACGNTFSKAPKHCAISLTESEKFIKFE